MEKEKTQEAMVATLVPMSPSQLREIATRMELALQKVTSNETILVKVTDKIMFTYQPKFVTETKQPVKLDQPFPFVNAEHARTII
jgi:hypothetical protein